MMTIELPKSNIEIDNLTVEYRVKSYSNGQKRSTGSYVSYHPVLNHAGWYENGNKRFEGFYRGPNIRFGKWSFWHKNGTLACLGQYKGKSEEEQVFWTFWDESGKRVHENKYNYIELSVQLSIIGDLSKFYLDGCSKDLMKKFDEYIFFTHRI
jgi:antitoxin component YwqK of YwqJK toxin-antitoxin module